MFESFKSHASKVSNISLEAVFIASLTATAWPLLIKSAANANGKNPSFPQIVKRYGGLLPLSKNSPALNGFRLSFFNVVLHRAAGTFTDNRGVISAFAAAGSAPWTLMMVMAEVGRKETLMDLVRQVLGKTAPRFSLNPYYLLAAFGFDTCRELLYNLGCLNPPEVIRKLNLNNMQHLAVNSGTYFVTGAITGIPNFGALFCYFLAVGAKPKTPALSSIMLSCMFRGLTLGYIFVNKDLATLASNKMGVFASSKPVVKAKTPLLP